MPRERGKEYGKIDLSQAFEGELRARSSFPILLKKVNVPPDTAKYDQLLQNHSKNALENAPKWCQSGVGVGWSFLRKRVFSEVCAAFLDEGLCGAMRITTLRSGAAEGDPDKVSSGLRMWNGWFVLCMCGIWR